MRICVREAEIFAPRVTTTAAAGDGNNGHCGKKTLRAAGGGPVRVTLLGALEWLFSRFEECLFCPDIYIIDLLLSGTLRTYVLENLKNRCPSKSEIIGK